MISILFDLIKLKLSKIMLILPNIKKRGVKYHVKENERVGCFNQ